MASGLVLIGLLYTAHYLIYCIPQPFYIEDAAISLPMRGAVDGSGLTTYAEVLRVEGYSNPSWTFLVAGLLCARTPRSSPPQRCWAGSSGWRHSRWLGR